MKRKVIKQGNNTLTITLPRDWTEKFGVKAGDELNLDELGNKISISVNKEYAIDSIKLNIGNLDRTSTLILIQGLYRYGYDDIEILTDNDSLTHYRTEKEVSAAKLVHEVVARFIGSEIVRSSTHSFEIKRISYESFEEFDTVLRRIFRLLNDMVDVFISSVEKNSPLSEVIEPHHANIKKFINYALRLLNKFGHPDPKKTAFYFSLIQYISKVEDFVKNASRYISKYKLKMTPRSIKFLKGIKESINLYYEFFYNYSNDRIAELNKKREDLRSSFFLNSEKLSKDESIILAGMMQIIEILLDMTELRIALETKSS